MNKGLKNEYRIEEWVKDWRMNKGLKNEYRIKE